MGMDLSDNTVYLRHCRASAIKAYLGGGYASERDINDHPERVVRAILFIADEVATAREPQKGRPQKAKAAAANGVPEVGDLEE